MVRLLFAFILAVIVSSPAFADITAARQSLVNGDYAQAQKLALAEQSAQGYILAAEALSAQVMLQEVSNITRSARKAKDYAHKALDLDPDNKEALIQYALALGFETRSSGIMKAWMGKMPEKSLAAINAASAASPEDARISGLRGAWHLGIVAKVGEENAQKWFEANMAEGLAGYEDAIAKRPQDAVILGNYALSLLSLNAPDQRPKIRELLRALQAAPIRTDIDRAIKARMAVFLPILEDPEAVKSAVEILMD